ncbi:AfsR/SARP family transcriptional regulator [uncultured Streptomyces sp.]|uniref:AfsR/SARP family transcriptional regulator n=1 Tax=uncultured Streptomyces sp. TaxID=174707 RepID=UPI00262C3B43|nr:AfsR/SARP family transcriptional regulator [uncultured Streptomyces sp.]
MRYEILGPVRAVAGDVVIDVGPAKMQLLLTALLVDAGRTVTASQLVAELWGDRPPRRAAAALHVYISQSRKLLAGLADPAAADCGSGTPLVTRSPGYAFQLAGAGLDAREFQTLMAEGRASSRAGHHERASRAFRRAAALWRGPWVGDLAEGPIISTFATWAGEARLECAEMLMEAHLACGRHREIIAPLRTLVAQHPLREAFHRLLMLALYRSERQGDALMAYQDARRSLRRALGVEPGRSLRQVQQQIICADRCLDLSAT